MKKIKNWFKERNNWHYLIGALLGIIFFLLTFEAVQLIGRILISAIIVLFGSIIWEMVWEDLKGYLFDWKDVKRSMIGWSIGTIITVIIYLILL